MNFFEHQRKARHHTFLLILMFSGAVISLMVTTTIFVGFFLGYLGHEEGTQPADMTVFFNWKVIGLVSGGVLFAVISGTLFKMAQLSSGGHVVAEMMNATRIDANTKDAQERRLYHVVEEMALAAGMAVPPVYVMREEMGINAFAAGYKLNDAVVAVTRGCLETLSRDELQGVIAHEFSHILNGDMRINIRMMAWLNGIMVIGLIGYYVMHTARFSGNRSKSNGGIFVIFSLALGLIAIGYGGMFFGNMIRAAMSRQREYLADASAVQFTRNPDGIGNALAKIAAHSHGTLLNAEHTQEVSHMLFGQGSESFLQSMFATHPPIVKRIKRILPNWTPEQVSQPPNSRSHHANSGAQTTEGASGLSNNAESLTGLVAGLSQVDAILDNTGAPSPAQVNAAQRTRQSLPQSWYTSCHETDTARAAIYALLIDDDAGIAKHQWQHIKNLDIEQLELTQYLLNTPLSSKDRIHIVSLALPQLNLMHSQQKADFIQLVNALIRADQVIDLFEWSLFAMLKHHFEPADSSLANKRLGQMQSAAGVVFSILSIVDNAKDSHQGAFQAACQQSQLHKLKPVDKSQINLGLLSEALDKLRHLRAEDKRVFLKACMHCITHDGVIDDNEYTLLHTIGSSLDCPIPVEPN